ncbi:MAG: hypothetical protein MUO58_01565 [Anaerolineales bacterium]|nr:hypothetical protein [Anaerolineales bacterium]
MASVLSISPESYWTSFEVKDDDIDFIINLLLEREVPLTSDEMASALVELRLVQLEKEAQEAEQTVHPIYIPAETYKVGQTLTFSEFGFDAGKVVGVREGSNPDLDSFSVITVAFAGDGEEKEFASELADHILNNPPEPEPEIEELSKSETIMDRYGEIISANLDERLDNVDDIVRIAGKWFPCALVAEITDGHLNLAEAVLDVEAGGPLPTADLLEHVELPDSLSPQLAEFSLDYALQEDERFDEVGPAGQVLWFLRRLEPPEVLFAPPRLECQEKALDSSLLTDELQELIMKLDDEMSDLQATDVTSDDVTVTLIFPHWRVGALPLSARLKHLFPTAYEAPRIRFILVDGHSGEKFPGWVVREHGYVFGLENWYRKYKVPAGGLVRVHPGEVPGEVVVETFDRRMRNDWIRTVTIAENGQIGFTMLKQPVGTAYDDLMVIGLIDTQALDEVWMQMQNKKLPLDRTVAHVFRELAKLTPQSAVHAQTLYAAVNVLQRQPPSTIFAELVRRPYFQHVGDLYWRFESEAWDLS